MTTEMIEAFCANQVDLVHGYVDLPSSSMDFLQRLSLPSVHPICNDENVAFNSSIPPMGPLDSIFDTEDTIWERLVTSFIMVIPPFWALFDLWFRLLAIYISSILTTWLIYKTARDVRARGGHLLTKDDVLKDAPHSRARFCLHLLSSATALILMVDAQYVQEFSHKPGLVIFVTNILLAVQLESIQRSSAFRMALFLLCLTAIGLTLNPATGTFNFGDKPADIPRVLEGLYFNHHNSLVNSIVSRWPEKYRTYSKRRGATPWMFTGDARTGLPYAFNDVPIIDFKRLWLPSCDGEFVALDIAFPAEGHDWTKPVYLAYHGLNGGSKEGYLLDLAYRSLQEGNTFVVMVARGLMDLPILGDSLFHAARVCDAHEAAKRIKMYALAKDQILIGVGYSIGGIVLNNYVASYGQHCSLDAAFSISGALDTRFQPEFERSRRTWQMMIGAFTRDQLLLPKWGQRIKAQLSRVAYRSFLRVTSVIDVDKAVAVDYSGFSSLDEFYAAMGALGDIPRDFYNDESAFRYAKFGRISNVSIPLCVLHALDDPIATWKSVTLNSGLMHPENLVTVGSGLLMVLLTERGGHVGWPLGWFPGRKGWQFMSDAVDSFAKAVVGARSVASAATPLPGSNETVQVNGLAPNACLASDIGIKRDIRAVPDCQNCRHCDSSHRERFVL